MFNSPLVIVPQLSQIYQLYSTCNDASCLTAWWERQCFSHPPSTNSSSGNLVKQTNSFLKDKKILFKGLLSVWAKIDMVHNLQFGNIFFIDVIVLLLTVIFSKSSIIIYWFRFQIKISIWLIHLCAILIWNDKIWSDHTL